MTRWVMEAARIIGSEIPGSEETKGESGAGLGELLHSGTEGLDVIVPEAEYNDLPVFCTLAL